MPQIAVRPTDHGQLHRLLPSQEGKSALLIAAPLFWAVHNQLLATVFNPQSLDRIVPSIQVSRGGNLIELWVRETKVRIQAETHDVRDRRSKLQPFRIPSGLVIECAVAPVAQEVRKRILSTIDELCGKHGPHALKEEGKRLIDAPRWNHGYDARIQRFYQLRMASDRRR